MRISTFSVTKVLHITIKPSFTDDPVFVLKLLVTDKKLIQKYNFFCWKLFVSCETSNFLKYLFVRNLWIVNNVLYFSEWISIQSIIYWIRVVQKFFSQKSRLKELTLGGTKFWLNFWTSHSSFHKLQRCNLWIIFRVQADCVKKLQKRWVYVGVR